MIGNFEKIARAQLSQNYPLINNLQSTRPLDIDEFDTMAGLNP
jgi:hypothetical protein